MFNFLEQNILLVAFFKTLDKQGSRGLILQADPVGQTDRVPGFKLACLTSSRSSAKNNGRENLDSFLYNSSKCEAYGNRKPWPTQYLPTSWYNECSHT